MVTLQLGQQSLCNSSEAEMHILWLLHRAQWFCYRPLSQHSLKWKQGGDALVPLWLSQTTGMCRIPDHKILATNYPMSILWMNWQTGASIWPPVQISGVLTCSAPLFSHIHICGV